MQEKEKIERYVFKNFIEKQNNTQIELSQIQMGDPHKKEPDIIFNNESFELGAIISSENTQIDKKVQIDFLNKANKIIKDKLNERLCVKLVFQDDKEDIKHTPKDEFKEYPSLAKYLDGFFIHLYPSKVKQQIVINQQGLMRVKTFPNPNKKEIIKFIDELTKFVNTKGHYEFKEKAFDSRNSVCSHYVVCDGELKTKPSEDILSKYFPKSILNKLSKNKYTNKYNKKYLIFHNYTFLKGFTSDVHFYQHYRNNIFNKIYELIEKSESFKFYNNIYFVDFTKFANNSDAEIIDFSNYNIRKINGNPNSERHIRIDLSNCI